MEKGTRHIKCPNCPPEKPTTLRIYVSVLEYGTTVEITCPKCGGVCKTTIPVPAPEPEPKAASKPTEFPFGDTFGDMFGDMFKPRR